MKKIIILFISLSIASCEWVEKIDRQMDADSTDVANDIEDMKALAERRGASFESGELLFKAVGSEPGWYAEFFTNKFRMLMNYGKDSIVLFREFRPGESLDFTYTSSGDGSNVKMSVKIEDKECIDDAGGKNPNSVTVEFNDKMFKGCGKPVK